MTFFAYRTIRDAAEPGVARHDGVAAAPAGERKPAIPLREMSKHAV
jgi:hypothetical protein